LLARECNNSSVPRPNGAETGERRLQLVLGLLVIGLTAFTLIAFLTPHVRIAVLNERLDLIINTSATIGAGAVAALGWARYRVTGESSAFYRAAAFLTLAAVNLGVMAVLASNRGPELGFSLDDPGPLPILSFVLARFVAAALLLIGGLAAVRHTAMRRRVAVLLVMAPAVLTLALLAILRRSELTSPLSADALRQLQQVPGEPLRLSGLSAGLLGVQLAIGAMFLGAAWLAYRSTVQQRRPADAYLSIGFVLAAFSQVHYAANPGSYAALVTTGDLLRIGFYGALLLGVIVQSRNDVRAIEEANAELRLLRDAEVGRALLEERGRLAREMHDGLAQDLWYARLKQGRLAQLVQGEEEKALAQDVMDAIDSGISDARQTVMAMRAGSTDAPLLEIVERYVEDFGDRFALDVRFESSGEPPELPARVQAEVLRIVQEALNNVRKHADATVIRVHAATGDGSLRIDVSDNGRGFQPEEPSGGFGLHSMRERAELIGAALRIESASRDGTRVRLSLPLGGDAR
jgi:signal transduction histidine kinase